MSVTSGPVVCESVSVEGGGGTHLAGGVQSVSDRQSVSARLNQLITTLDIPYHW